MRPFVARHAGRLLLAAVCATWLLTGRSSVAEELPRLRAYVYKAKIQAE